MNRQATVDQKPLRLLSTLSLDEQRSKSLTLKDGLKHLILVDRAVVLVQRRLIALQRRLLLLHVLIIRVSILRLRQHHQQQL